MGRPVSRMVWIAAAVMAAGAAQAQIKIGIAGPLTGPNAAFGAQLRNGVEQAVADINAKGGVLSQQLTVSVGDDVSDPRQGVSVANKLVGDGVRLVVGHFNSGVSMPASEVYAENGALMITPASTNPQITDRGLWNVFRTCGRDDQQGLVAAEHIARTFGDKRIAIVHDKTTYGMGLANETRKALLAKNVRPLMFEGVNTGEKDFSALIGLLKAQRIEFVYWGGLHTEIGLIIRQASEQNMKLAFMGADGIASDELASIAGPALEGMNMTFPPDPRRRPDAAEVVKRFEARGINPEAYTLYSYAAVEIIKQAAEEAKSTDPKKISAVMKSGRPFNTVLGSMTYDKKGDRTNLDYVVYTWKKGNDGKLTYVQN